MSHAGYWDTQLDEVAASRADQRSFHVFAEGAHSDVRGQVFNLPAGDTLRVWSSEWPEHCFVVLCISGTVDANLADRVVAMRPLSQLVVLPTAACELRATADVSLEIISFRSSASGQALQRA
jgi:hypothetical protein